MVVNDGVAVPNLIAPIMVTATVSPEEWQAQPFLIAPTAVQNESWGNIKNSLTR